MATPASVHPDPNALDPDVALRLVKEGNTRFLGDAPASYDRTAEVEATAEGQAPYAAVLSCIDSRVPAERIFDLGIGHMFSARVAGNVLSDDVLGSLEYATAAAGTRLVVVLGHTGCGAVKGACDSVELGHVTGLVNKIKASVEAVDTDGERSSKNAAFVDDVAAHNARRTADELLERSDIIRGQVEDGTVKVVSAIYDVRSGEVTFFGDAA